MKLRILLIGLMTLVAAPSAAADEAKTVLDGLDPIALIKGDKTAGREDLTVVHEGFKYHFASAEHQAAFQKSPDKYAVANLGNCPVAKVKMNKEIKGQPNLYSVHQGRIYLFGRPEAKAAFDAEPAQFIKKKSEGS